MPRQVVVANVEAMERWAGDMSRVLASAGLSRRDLDDEGRRFTWAELSAVMEAFGEARSDEEVMAFGEEYVNAFPGFRELASLLVSPLLLYRFVVRASPRYWSELDFEIDDRGSRVFHVRCFAHASWTPNRTFFASAIGMFRNLGTLVGSDPAEVHVHGFSSHHNDFTLEVPAARELRERLREARLVEEMATVMNELLSATGLREGPRFAALGSAPSVYDLKLRWGFTVAEARLARRIANGMSLKGAAADLGVRHETARSQLKRVMEKAVVGRQADLVRVLVR